MRKAMRARLRLACLAVAPLAACGGSSEDTVVNVPFSILSSTSSAWQSPHTLAIRDTVAWASFWSQHAPSTPQPTVDFTQKMVLVVTEQASDSCPQVSVSKVQVKDGALQLTYNINVPGPDATCLAVISYPTQVVLIPTFNLPAIFHKN